MSEGKRHNGPNYSLTGVPSRPGLPRGVALQSGLDESRGDLESWPVHPVAQSTSNLSLGQAHRPKSVMHHGKRKPASRANPEKSIIPKPKFLEQLESYLHRELQKLGCTMQGPNLIKLQAYREVFDYLMEDFRTYKPLLSAIKNEYELVILYQQEEIRKLEPLETTVGTLEEECERKIIAMKQEEKTDVHNLQQENKRLCRVIDQANQNKALLQAQVDKMSEQLSVAYKKYRDEADARKLLLSDLNEMRFREKDSSKSKVEEDDDPVLLKLFLNRAQEDLKLAQTRLNEVLADYQDVVPRNEFTTLEQTYLTLQEEHDKLKGDYRTLMQEHNTLLGVHKEVVSQRDKFARESEQMKRSSTPRPDWERCGEHIEGGTERWNQLMEGHTSDEMIDILISELTGTGLEHIQQPEFFEAQGTSEDIPKHLQFDGQVRNRKLTRKDTMLFIEDVWQERQRLRTTETELQAFPDFFFLYLQQRFFDQNQVVEWGYNVHDACTRFHGEDQRIALFGDILSTEVDEEVYHQQEASLKQLSEGFDAVAGKTGEKDVVSKDELSAIIANVFPAKSQAAIDALLKVCEDDQQLSDTSKVNYKKLLAEDASSTAPFLDLLRRQEEAERNEFVSEIVQALKGKSDVTVDELRQAVLAVNPGRSEYEVVRVLMRGFAFTKASELDDCTDAIETSSLVKLLQTGAISRVGRRE